MQHIRRIGFSCLQVLATVEDGGLIRQFGSTFEDKFHLSVPDKFPLARGTLSSESGAQSALTEAFLFHSLRNPSCSHAVTNIGDAR
ncbi:hypothetical protein [Ensifer adhaerens]|uniref:hypothetical protein n=1 Tax=Ensifer adhaerens TaxID=106592 RepID=UPI001C4DF47A|nr:hypothetical protein [Ensifer adhaerens]MBW0370808.1 hypothetical protein [Ensifer adhaerens]UCM24266.1 hypothetical protein LDL63_31495 [Ensifer adhaerens]